MKTRRGNKEAVVPDLSKMQTYAEAEAVAAEMLEHMQQQDTGGHLWGTFVKDKQSFWNKVISRLIRVKTKYT